MGANKLIWEEFLKLRAEEAHEREKHSKYYVSNFVPLTFDWKQVLERFDISFSGTEK